eukprot:356789-Chlamydomonas_euryale.AAC.2
MQCRRPPLPPAKTCVDLSTPHLRCSTAEYMAAAPLHAPQQVRVQYQGSRRHLAAKGVRALHHL